MSDMQLHQSRKVDRRDDGGEIWHQCVVVGPEEESCPEAGLLSAWIDGSLSGEELDRVEAHLCHCGECLETVVCIRSALAGKLEKASCSLDPLHDLVRPADRPFSFAEVLHWFFPPRPRPVVVLAGLVFMMAASGYLGSRMAADHLLIHRSLAAEISFDFDVVDNMGLFAGGNP